MTWILWQGTRIVVMIMVTRVTWPGSLQDTLKLTHLPLVPHLCVIESGSIGWDNGLSLYDAKPLSKPILGFCQLDPYEQTSVKFWSTIELFIQENSFENIVCEWRPFCRGADELTGCGRGALLCPPMNGPTAGPDGGEQVSGGIFCINYSRIHNHSMVIC